MMRPERLWDHLNTEAALLRERIAVDPEADRLFCASETVARMRSEFGRFGITRLAQVTGLDQIGIPVWMTVRPNARTLAVCQGKGVDDASAQASAIMEAVELATAEHASLPTRFCSAAKLVGDGATVMPLHDLIRSRAVSPFDQDVLHWVEGYDLIAERPVWVPKDAVAFGKADASSGRYWWSSDGLASGNLLLEAVVHGLCERIERDAAVLWLLRSDRDVLERCIDPADVDDESVDALRIRIEQAGLQLRLFDMTSDVGVPVVFATISPASTGNEQHWKHFDLSSGSGCNPSPARAAIGAITEAAQSRVTSITGSRDDYDPSMYRTPLQADLLTYLKATPCWRMTADADAVSPADKLPFLVARLESAGIRSIVVVPLEADEPGFAVAKVIVSDLEQPPGDRRRRFGKRALRAMAGLQ
jgi:YcaO-like protein with predicted kinase domain